MLQSNLKILTEFNDDIDAICSELERVRDELEKANEEISTLEEEARDHQCDTSL